MAVSILPPPARLRQPGTGWDTGDPGSRPGIPWAILTNLPAAYAILLAMEYILGNR